MASNESKSSPLLIVAAWAIVILPAAWGLNLTVQNALKIFVKPVSVKIGSPNPMR